MKDYKSIKEKLEEQKAIFCDEYCRYPREPIPEGKDDNWLLEKDSPCNTKCPLNYM